MKSCIFRMLQLLLLLDDLQLRYLSTDALVRTICLMSDAIELNKAMRPQTEFAFCLATPAHLFLQMLLYVHFYIVRFYNR